jgi:para-aminobenzoate synthetase/4-amino-4-deoxychorismate lyase
VCANAHEMSAPAGFHRVTFARAAIDRDDSRIFNKTTDRSAYEELLSATPHVDDVILWNAEGEVTESTIANIVVEIDGQLYTPALTSGLLAGTQRAELLDRGIVKERVITKQELAAEGSFYLLNSVRGWVRAELIEPIQV